MFKKAKPFFIHTITPLHAGSGEDLGYVDLPIQRERHTSFPKIEGSSLKGAMREVFEDKIEGHEELTNGLKDKEIEDANASKIFTVPSDLGDFKELNKPWIYKDKEKKNGNSENKYKKKKIKIDGKQEEEVVLTKYHEAISLSFGPEEGDAHAGALGFTDARLLLFPVKSMKGVFAWITCPAVLEQFKRDMELCNDDMLRQAQHDIFAGLSIENGKCIVAEGGSCKIKVNKDKVILEEYTFSSNSLEKVNNIATNITNKIGFDIKEKLVILSDDDFRDFVNLSTEVITRTKISAETGTVEPGALWTEEYLPAESVLYSLALATRVFHKEKGILQKNGEKEEDRVLQFFTSGCPEYMQIGGNATIGKGIVRIIRPSTSSG